MGRKKKVRNRAEARFLAPVLFLDFSYLLRTPYPGNQGPFGSPFPALLTTPRPDCGWQISKEPGGLPVPDGISGTTCAFPDKHKVIWSSLAAWNCHVLYKTNYLKLALTSKLEPSSVFSPMLTLWGLSVLHSSHYPLLGLVGGTGKQWEEWLKFQNRSISRQSGGNNRHFLGGFVNGFLLNLWFLTSPTPYRQAASSGLLTWS